MKIAICLGLLCAGVAAFYFNGGAASVGFGMSGELPETIAPPQATFLGDKQENPFAK